MTRHLVIILTGGGTGGHITPILAVAHELKRLNPECKVIYVGEKGGQFSHLTNDHPDIDEVYSIFAGKFRRYHGQSWLERLTDVKTILLNIRDVFFLLFGLAQAFRLLGRIKPDVIFLKGGFVGVPIGLAAVIRRKPFITHDSDALPGLANRLVSRWANLHAVALPASYYKYPVEKIRTVGVLVEHSFQLVTPELQKRYRKELRIPESAEVLLVTGGSSGAERINQAIVKIAQELLAKRQSLYIIHQAGKGKAKVYGDYANDRLQVLEFLRPMSLYMGAADVVVSRASANTFAELGIQGKASIAIPNPDLTGGHQLKNAERLAEQGAAIVVPEDKLYDLQQGLLPMILLLLDDIEARKKLGRRLQSITKPDAAKELALLLLNTAQASAPHQPAGRHSQPHR